VELARDGIVGREIELAAVASFLDGTAARPVALVIDGELGIGKTTISRAALDRRHRPACASLRRGPS
jgi:tRNA A37 threonylcarbamoyladenosine biosynthesis protein TsaE